MSRDFWKYSPYYNHNPLLYYVYNAPSLEIYIILNLVSFIIIIRKGEVFQRLGVKQRL
jgi:hypothetical protein